MGYFSIDMEKTTESAINNALTNLGLYRETIDRLPEEEKRKHYIYLLDFIEVDLKSALRRNAGEVEDT
ncbi:MAG: hypothetical protein EOP83_04165 [Verrucomicrobiaceae bacterium]|nr:MAG: hypothetical protein EOP83_04165 [Verrucomicrobiaceae bacterium]